MRALGLTLALAALAVAGCSKPAGEASTETAAAPAAPPATPEQKQAMQAALPAPYNTADLVNGEAKFAMCRACHSIEKDGPNMTGPHIYGVLGRKAAAVEGYSYSEALKAAGFSWDVGHMDQWLASPKTLVPGTKMTFAGLSNHKDRTDLIAYLAVEASDPPK